MPAHYGPVLFTPHSLVLGPVRDLKIRDGAEQLLEFRECDRLVHPIAIVLVLKSGERLLDASHISDRVAASLGHLDW